MAKRGREEEPEYVSAAHDLEAAASRDADAARKTKACGTFSCARRVVACHLPLLLQRTLHVHILT